MYLMCGPRKLFSSRVVYRCQKVGHLHGMDKSFCRGVLANQGINMSLPKNIGQVKQYSPLLKVESITEITQKYGKLCR